MKGRWAGKLMIKYTANCRTAIHAPHAHHSLFTHPPTSLTPATHCTHHHYVHYDHTHRSALYWSVTTMTTVGYGDIVPANDGERVYAVMSMVVGGGFYGYIIASMASLVSSFDVNQKMYYEKMDQVVAYMRQRAFPGDLFRRVKRYYKHYYEHKSAIDESTILMDLSTSLRQEVALFLINDVVYKVGSGGRRGGGGVVFFG